MGKPRRKERSRPNKSRRGDIIFEKIESTMTQETSTSHPILPKIISNNYLPTTCHWTTQAQYHDSILAFLKAMKAVPYSQLIDLGTQFCWDLDKIKEKILLTTDSEIIRGQVLPRRTDEVCEICQEPKAEFYQFECGHGFCLGCCRDYLSGLVREGTPAIVKKTCPKDECKVLLFIYIN